MKEIINSNLKYLQNKTAELEKQAEYEKATEVYDELIELDPQNIEYYQNKAACLNKLRRYKEEKK